MNRATSSRAVAFAFAAVAALSWSAGAPLRADESRAATRAHDVEAALQKLGPAPSADAVLRLVRSIPPQDREAALRFAGALLTHGGHACAHGLRALVQNRDADVRAAALRGIAQTRMRVAENMDLVRAARADSDSSVRDAAYAAAGTVGDAEDMSDLLGALSSEDASVVAAAYAALRDLSGARLRCRALVWRQWWKDTEAATPARLVKALATIEKGAEAAELLDAEEFVARNAWVRLRDVTDRVAAWIGSQNPTLRREGYRGAADLRLGDLADRLATALAQESDAACLRVGLESARTLGAATRADLDVR
jgi:hypothetical protein